MNKGTRNAVGESATGNRVRGNAAGESTIGSRIRMLRIRTGMTIPPEEMADIYEYIGARTMWDMLDEL